jgi:hypothetical protein
MSCTLKDDAVDQLSHYGRPGHRSVAYGLLVASCLVLVNDGKGFCQGIRKRALSILTPLRTHISFMAAGIASEPESVT